MEISDKDSILRLHTEHSLIRKIPFDFCKSRTPSKYRNDRTRPTSSFSNRRSLCVFSRRSQARSASVLGLSVSSSPSSPSSSSSLILLGFRTVFPFLGVADFGVGLTLAAASINAWICLVASASPLPVVLVTRNQRS